MRTQFVLWSIAATTVLCTLSYAAEQTLQGAFVTPKGDLPLHNSPPGGFIGLVGESVGKVTPSKTYKVLSEKSYSTILGGEKWLEIQGVEDPSKRGWVYAGSKSDPTANVHVTPSQ